jgi:hypothetical protein
MLPCSVPSLVVTPGGCPRVAARPCHVLPASLGRSLVCAAAKKQKAQTKKVRKPKQPEQRRIRYAQDLQDGGWRLEQCRPVCISRSACVCLMVHMRLHNRSACCAISGHL